MESFREAGGKAGAGMGAESSITRGFFSHPFLAVLDNLCLFSQTELDFVAPVHLIYLTTVSYTYLAP